MSQAFFPGHETRYASDSPTSDFIAIFEDDGETGYFYAYDRRDSRVLEAVHIYTVSAVLDKGRESVADILWSTDGMKAALLINDYPHAVLNFAEHC